MSVISFSDERAFVCSDNLKRIYDRLTEYRMKLDNVRRSIAKTRGIDYILPALGKTCEKISDIADCCERLCRSLDTIIQIYTEAEKGAIESGEDFSIPIMQQETEVIGLEQSIKLINAFK